MTDKRYRSSAAAFERHLAWQRDMQATYICPNPDECEAIFHGSLQSGMAPGDTCECCGVEWEGDEGVAS